VLSGTSFTEKCVERIVTSTDRLVGWHLSIRLDSMLQTEQLPASISGLNTSLPNVD
jgi:hypothetical protein